VRQRRRIGLLLRLQQVEAVERLARAEHRVTQVPGHGPRAHLGVDEEHRRILGVQLLQGVGRAAQRIAIRVLGKFLALPQGNEQHALGRDARQAAQEQRRAGLRRQIAERLFQRAARGLIDALRRRGEVLIAVHAEHHATAFCALGRESLYAKFHSESIA
jgi:hypothetical protein